MSIAYKVSEALARGEILPEYMEEKRLLPTSHEAAREFSADMHRIHERLLKGLNPNYNKADFPIEFMLSVDEQPNAFIVSKGPRPLVVFTTGLIQDCKNESELAGVLVHELGHNHFRKLLGPHENGFLEELGSDLASPYVLRKANYPMNGLRTFAERWPDDTLPDFLSGLNDPHPMKKTRVSALQTAERATVRGKFGMGEQTNAVDAPIRSELKRVARAATFTSHIDRILATHGYERANTAQKMSILEDVITNEMPKSDRYFKSRVEDLTRRIKSLRLDPQKDKAAIDSMVEALIKLPNKDDPKGYYEALQSACGVKTTKGLWGKVMPLGKLAELDQRIARFVAAESPQEIQAAARALNEMARRYEFDGQVMRAVEFSKFKMHGAGTIKAASAERPIFAPWEKHVAHAAAGSDMEVLESLKRLGITHDPRLVTLLPQVDHVDIIHGTAPDLDKRLLEFGEGLEAKPYKVAFDDKGRIIGLKDVGHDTLYAEEAAIHRQRLAQRAANEQALVGTTNWRALEEDFEGFVRTHNETLRPHISIVSGPHPFAERFVEECETLIRKDPEKFKPLVEEYFSPAAKRGVFRLLHGTSFDKTHGDLRIPSRDVGIGLDHPFAKFVLDDPQHLFGPSQKLAMMEHVRYFNGDPALTAASAESRWLFDNRKIFAELPCKSITELETWLGKLKATLLERTPMFGFAADLIPMETLRTLQQTKRPLSLKELRLVTELAGFNGSLDAGVSDALRAQVVRVSKEFAEASKLSGELPALLEEFRTLGAERTGSHYYPPVFTEQPQLRMRYQDAIKHAVEHAADPAMRMECLEGLLFRHEMGSDHRTLLEDLALDRGFSRNRTSTFRYDGALVDPEFKEWVAKRYASELADHLGADTGTAEYAAKFKSALERIETHAPGGNAMSVLGKLGTKECGNRLLIQDVCAGHLKSVLDRMGLNAMVKHNFHAAVGEGVLNSLGRNYETRDKTIDFLTKTFSEENAAKLIRVAEEGLSEREREKFLAETLSQEAKIEQMRLLHKNFWSLPFEGRVLASKQILFDTEYHTDAAEAVNKNVKLVLDKIMPLDQAGPKAELRHGRRVIESYLEASHDLEDRRIITSAMLVANEPNGATAGAKLSVGKGLNLVLGAIDPAGDKVKQAIESHNATPQHIRDEFRNSKTMARDPSRHEWLDWVKDSNAHCAEHERIIPGQVLGAGSYGFTIEGIRPDGHKIARTILYPHVRAKAENEFAILTKAADIQVVKDKRFAPLTDMIRQAHRMSAIETDMDIAARQAQVADKLYDGMRVTVGDKTYTFGTAKYLGHGVDHKDFEIAEGLHFNDLAHAAQTAEELAHVKGLAKAQVAAELYNILAGRPFDHDVHGGQQKIIGEHIVRFDHGAQSVYAASAREKQMLGHVLGGTIKQHYVKGVPIAEALRTEIKRVATTAAEMDFLASTERGVLALGNFQNHLQGDELGEVIGAMFAGGKVDPAIKAAMEERLGAISGRVFSELEKKGKASGITIETIEHVFDASPDTSPLKPPPREGLLERIPLKNQHIVGGAGVVSGFAGFGMLWHANRRIHHKKETGQEVTRLDRAEQVGGAITGVGGTVVAVDGLTLDGKGVKSIGQFKRHLADEGFEVLRNAEGRISFSRVGLVAGAAAAVGGALLYMLNQGKKKDPIAVADTSWAGRVNTVETQQIPPYAHL